MEKLENVWVVANSAASISELTAGAAVLGEKVTLVYAGDIAAAAGAHIAYYMGPLGESASYVGYVGEIAKMAAAGKPSLVLLDTSKNGRLAASCIATACSTAVLTDAMDLALADGSLSSSRMVYGGSAFKKETASGTAVVCVGVGVFTAAGTGLVPEVRMINAPSDGRVKLLEKRPKQGQSVNIAAAKRLVSVGRGFGEEKNLGLARAFSEAIGAELSCSRPVAEELKWFPKERYVGVSGAMVKPELYFAVGISGQVQHMAGVSQAGTIIAVNSDKNAPIFKQCDYGIVGDLRTVLPALTAKLKK